MPNINLKEILDKVLNKPWDPLGLMSSQGLEAPLRVGDVASMGLDIMPGVGDVKSAVEGVNAFKQGDNLGGALGLAGALPFVGGTGIISGVRALGGRMSKIPMLKEAEAMLNAGQDPAHVWKETGFGLPADNHWRWEIPDHNAYLDQEKLLALDKEGGVPLPKVFDHPELYKYYPSAKNLNLNIADPSMMGTSRASYSPHTENIFLSRNIIDPDEREAFDSLIHELQHHVQSRELRQHGSSYERAQKLIDADKQKYQQAWRDAANAGDNEAIRKYRSLYNFRESPGERYWRSGGEAEARLAQMRSSLDSELSRKYYPWDPVKFYKATDVNINNLDFEDFIRKNGQEIPDWLLDFEP